MLVVSNFMMLVFLMIFLTLIYTTIAEDCGQIVDCGQVVDCGQIVECGQMMLEKSLLDDDLGHTMMTSDGNAQLNRSHIYNDVAKSKVIHKTSTNHTIPNCPPPVTEKKFLIDKKDVGLKISITKDHIMNNGNIDSRKNNSTVTFQMVEEQIRENRNVNHDKEQQHCKCTCCKNRGNGVTIVTALFDIGRKKWPAFKRTYEEYLNFSKNVLKLNVNLVFYIEEKGRSFVERHRFGKEKQTEIVVLEWKNLTYYRYLPAMENVMQSEEFQYRNGMLRHPEGFSPRYNLLMSAKYSLMYKTTQTNPFNSKYFYWIDAGYGHNNDEIEFPDFTCPWAPCSILNDKISYIQLQDTAIYKPAINQLHKLVAGPAISGGFFGGSIDAILQYYKLYTSTLEEWLRNDRIDDDQTLALACYFRKPHLFNLVKGEWNDAFKLFT